MKIVCALCAFRETKKMIEYSIHILNYSWKNNNRYTQLKLAHRQSILMLLIRVWPSVKENAYSLKC